MQYPPLNNLEGRIHMDTKDIENGNKGHHDEIFAHMAALLLYQHMMTFIPIDNDVTKDTKETSAVILWH